MSEINKSFFSPAKAWKYLAKKPVTLPLDDVIKNPREAADNYRGFHTNDWEKCIGCGTCSKICPAEAITMIKIPELPDEEGSKPERPAFDYGRCTFCGLCVDICTTGSLNMSKEYVHLSKDPNSFFFLPKEDGIHHIEVEKAYQRTEDSELLDLERVPMEILDADTRKKTFLEVVKGFSKQQAIEEASRCVDCGICTKTCPAHMDIPDYIRTVYDDNVKEGLRWLYKTNPLPLVCGKMCTHRCETACTIGHRGEAVSIRWLKRYIVDQIPAEEYHEVLKHEQQIIKKVDKKIAIVGGGPAGLSAAYYLILMGYKVTVFEAEKRPGGVLNYGGPVYRLPLESFEKDWKYIESLGVEFRLNTRVGVDVTLEELKDNYDAVFLSSGFTLGRSTGVPGTEHPMVKQAMVVLKEMKYYVIGDGPKPYIPKKLVVIGGGNVAMDVARTMVRLQNIEYGKSEVHVVSLERTLDEMPADWDEKHEGGEEGVIFHPGWGPIEIVTDGDKVKKARFKKVLSIFDENRRFNPKYDESQILEIEADLVVESIGQMPDYSYLPEEIKEKIEIVRGRIKTDEYNHVVGVPWLFAGGDIVHGPDIIHGIADGHKAAQGIDFYLTGYDQDKNKK